MNPTDRRPPALAPELKEILACPKCKGELEFREAESEIRCTDCWPVASWSSLDYFGRWKALHYAARRFYAPLMLSIEDKPPEQGVYVSNDWLKPWEGTLNWSIETLAGEALTSGQAPVKVAPQASTLVCKLDFSDQITDDNRRNLVLIAELWQGDRFVIRLTAYFDPIKHLSLADPAISMNLQSQNGELIVELISHSLALLVEVSLNGADVVFSDNYFNLPSGRSLQISCPLPVGWTLSRAQKEIRVRSVYDSYSHRAPLKGLSHDKNYRFN